MNTITVTPVQVLETFRLINFIENGRIDTTVDEDIAIMRAYLGIKMKKLENTMKHQIGYLEANYGHASTSLDLKKPSYYDKMMEIYERIKHG